MLHTRKRLMTHPLSRPLLLAAFISVLAVADSEFPAGDGGRSGVQPNLSELNFVRAIYESAQNGGKRIELHS